MEISDLHLNLLGIFFIYGLAFFTMGIALTLEAGRSPRLAERPLLAPLAAFGLIHGMHEWMEIYLMQAQWLGVTLPVWLEWTRVGILGFSFLPLILFGHLGIRSLKKSPNLDISAASVSSVVLVILIWLALSSSLRLTDTFTRYLLAVPGGFLAAAAMFIQAKQHQANAKAALSRRFYWSALGFGLYAISQLFVPQADIFPARWINAEFFIDVFGIPIQVVRAAAALLVTYSLLKAIQIVDQERNEQLVLAQRERLLAAERIQQELLAREALRSELLRHIVTAQEDERARISHELHDETAQLLTAFSLDLATLRSQISKRSKSTEIIERLQNHSRQISRSVHNLVHDLRPAQLDDLGLAPALHYLCEQTKRKMDLNATLEIIGTRRRLDPLVETVLFRVAQESLTNIKRHAKTPCAYLRLTFNDERVILQVRDDGIGFDPNKELIPPHGWGLAGMRERAESVGGRLNISSREGEGTLVEITIPADEPGPSIFEEAADGNK
jgi:signal transduction histidine kinase